MLLCCRLGQWLLNTCASRPSTDTWLNSPRVLHNSSGTALELSSALLMKLERLIRTTMMYACRHITPWLGHLHCKQIQLLGFSTVTHDLQHATCHERWSQHFCPQIWLLPGLTHGCVTDPYVPLEVCVSESGVLQTAASPGCMHVVLHLTRQSLTRHAHCSGHISMHAIQHIYIYPCSH